MGFASNYSNNEKPTLSRVRQLAQKEAVDTLTRDPDAVRASDEELADNLEKVYGKAKSLKGKIRESMQDKRMPVTSPEVRDAVRRLFPGDPQHEDGNYITFEMYAVLLDKIEEWNDFNNADLWAALDAKHGFQAYRVNQPDVNIPFEKYNLSAVELSAYLIVVSAAFTSFLNAPDTSTIALSSTLTPNPAGSAAANASTFSKAVAIISTFANGKGIQVASEALSVLDEFGIDTSVLRSQLDNLAGDTGSDGISLNVSQTPIDVESKREDTEKVIRHTHASMQDAIGDDPSIMPWYAYLQTAFNEKEVDGWRRIVKEQVNTVGDRAAEINQVAEDTVEPLKYVDGIGDGVSKLGTNTYEGVNQILDCTAGYLSTAYGPGYLCCLARTLGMSLDGDKIKVLSKAVGLLNCTFTFDFKDALNSAFNQYNSMIHRFFSKQVIARIEELFKTTMREFEELEEDLRESSEAIDIIMTCPPIADMMLIIKQVILDLEGLLKQLSKYLENELLLSAENYHTTSMVAFESALAQKLSDVLDGLAVALDTCEDPATEEGTSQLIDTLNLAATQEVQIQFKPDGDTYSDFTRKRQIKTSFGSIMEPGVQSGLDNVNIDNAQQALDQCMKLGSPEKLRTILRQMRAIREV